MSKENRQREEIEQEEYELARLNAAFPTLTGQTTGMSLRDYFAAKAMAAMVSLEQNVIAMGLERGARESIVNDAYRLADAMLVEREKKS